MKKIIFVNNNMNIGGVQKSLCNLLKEISGDYDITLLLFSNSGDYLCEIPQNIEIKACTGIYKYFGVSQKECKSSIDIIIRGILALATKFLGRDFVLKLMNVFQKKVNEEYDYAISFLHDGNKNSFYGGCNEFVLSKIKAKQKIAFLHCDYDGCGANYESNNKRYKKFDKIAACSDGCKNVFNRCVTINPENLFTVINCNNYDRITKLSDNDPEIYDKDFINVVSVARLTKEKGIDRGIKAVQHAIKNGLNVKYHIVGGGILQPELQKLCEEADISGNVVFYGNCSNPYRYLKNADLLLIPSYHEAAPLVIDEARCLSVPVLSTRTTSSDDMILNTNCGWVCDNSQKGLNDLLSELIKNESILKQKKKEMQKIEVNNSIALQNFYTLLKK